MELLRWVNFCIGLLFFISYLYQFVYIPVSLFYVNRDHRKKYYNDKKYAVLICARNEEICIGDLIESINNQSYPKENIAIFVIADNCTDNTSVIAENLGAVVYKRFDSKLVGKGYAMDAFLQHIKEDYSDEFDGYFVFDADNILDKNYILEMHNCHMNGNEIITSFRNSKNYGSNMISAGYALWFMRENRFLNASRSILNTSCAVSGTGYFFSRKVASELDGWPFHLLTEDIEFTIDQVIKGKRIAYCSTAYFYDEQPVSFSQSVRQRMRWAKGYLQVFNKYGDKLIEGMFKGNFSCFDMTMNIMPAFLLTLTSILVNSIVGIISIYNGNSILPLIISLAESLLNLYLTLFFIGAVTTFAEWKRINTTTIKKIVYMFTFPLFMSTYLPISIAACFCRCEWKPIKHTFTAQKMKSIEKYESFDRIAV